MCPFILSLMMLWITTTLYAEELSRAVRKHLEAAKGSEEQAAAFERVVQEH